MGTTRWIIAGALLSLVCSAVFVLRRSGPAPHGGEGPPVTPAAITDDEARHAVGFRSGPANTICRHFPFEMDWTQRPPREVWRIAVGPAWSGFAAAAGRVFTQEQRGESEAVVCYELATGRELWVHEDAAYFRDQEGGGGDGPRATPTVVGNAVYTLGATGLLNCLDAKSGRPRWPTMNIPAHSGAIVPRHGFAGSPLVVGATVIVSAGGVPGRSLLAYDVKTGHLIWQGGSDPAGYSSPVLCKLAGTWQILILNEPGLAAHDLNTGEVLWQHPWRETCSQPVPLHDHKLLIYGSGQGACLLNVARGSAGWSVTPLWNVPRLNTKFSSAVIRGGCAFGLDNGILTCVDVTDGKRRWKRGRYGEGQILLLADVLLVQTETGEIVLVEANEDRHVEIARYRALSETAWNQPTLAGKYLLVRNRQEAVCLEMPVAQ